MNAPSSGRLGPKNIPFPISLLFIPLFLIAGALSIPYMAIVVVYIRRHERRFVREMVSLNRVMDWSRFVQALDEKHGTVIEEWLSEAGPARRWWTADDVAGIGPGPVPEERLDALGHKMRFDAFCSWCYENYTSDKSGQALLLSSSYIPEMRRRMEDIESKITIPVVSMAATSRQRLSWANRIVR